MTLLLSSIMYFLICLIIYNYFLYPISIIFLSKIIKNPHACNTTLDVTYPTVTLIIAAFNEEKVIRKKIENSINIDYPKDKIEVIIVSDGSDDNTPNIVKEFSDIIGIHEAERKGKSAALNRAASMATSEILVFSDANNDFSTDAIKHLVKHFSDRNIDAVTGAKHIYSNSTRQAAEGDGLYWKYESKIKKAESHLGSITAAEGEILAVRRSSFIPIDETLINDDAAITFNVVKSGKRMLYEENAKAYEEASLDLVDDYHVKVRMTSGGFQTIVREKHFLFPPTSWFAFSFFSHKILRWLVPHFMILIFSLSVILVDRLDALILLVLQIIFYTLSGYGWYKRKSKLPSYIYIPMYFSSMNFALFMGFFKFLNKKQRVQWKKAKR